VRFKAGTNFYRYAANEPTNLIDPTGLSEQRPGPNCCPKDEEDKILKFADNARDKLRELRETGTISVGPNTQAGGMTFCLAWRDPQTGRPMGSYQPKIFIDPNAQPCIYKCIAEHEAVHSRMCNALGPGYFNLSTVQKEIPAYTQELGCYLRMLLENGLGPYRQ
jgi:hypothetical protein